MGSSSRYGLRFCALGSIALGAAVASCSGDTSDDKASSGSIVVGVMSDLAAGADIARVRMVARGDGRALRDQTFQSNSGDAPLAFPAELWLSDLPGGTSVEVGLEVFKTYYPDEQPLIVRDAATHIVKGHTHLLRMRLERECIPNARLTSDLNAPTCSKPETCVAATCVDPYIPPEQLEEYSPTWATTFVDECKSAEPGDPIIEIGEGKDEHKPLLPADIVQVEAGPQGGFHIWISIRMKGLHRSGSRTTVDVYRLDSSELLGSFAAIQSYEPVADGYCELSGLRCQITLQTATDVQGVLGKTLQVVVKVADESGDVGISDQLITLSENVVK